MWDFLYTLHKKQQHLKVRPRRATYWSLGGILRGHIRHNRTGGGRFKVYRDLFLRIAKNVMVQYAI